MHRRHFGVAEDCSFQKFVLEPMSDAQHPLMSQMYWLRDSSGQVPMDYVGRFFRLQAEFERVCETLGIEDPALPRFLPGPGLDYRDFYNNRMIRLVGDRYRDDIDYFGFEFAVDIGTPPLSHAMAPRVPKSSQASRSCRVTKAGNSRARRNWRTMPRTTTEATNIPPW